MSDEDDDLQSWGWTGLSSYSSLLWDWEEGEEEETQTGVMSRRSLRLEDSLLPHSSASFSAEGASWRSSRTLRPRRSQQLSTSCSESLLLPRTPRKSSGPAALDNSLHSVASDASLLSSLVEESTLHESTLVDTLWGLDNDSDIKVEESAAPVEESSAADKPPLSRLYCTNCEASSSSCVSASTQPERRESATVYRGGGGRRKRRRENVLTVVGRVAAHCFALLLHIWRLLLGSKVTQEARQAARPAPPGVMSLKEAPTETKEAQPAASLCKVLADVLGPPLRRWSRSCSSCSRLTRSLLGLLLLLLLLLLSVSWFGPPTLQSVLLSDWTAALSECRPEASESQSGESAVRPQEEPPLHLEPAETDDEDKEAVTSVAASVEWARVSRLERRLAALWERVESRGRQEERRHDETLRLYEALRQQREDEGAWLSQHLDQQLSLIRKRLDEDRQQRAQMRQTDLLQQRAHTARLDQLELQLKALAAKTQQVQVKQEVSTSMCESTSTLPVAVSVAADRQSHEALMAEVSRLEAALQDMRRDVESLSGCGDGCRQLAAVQQEISGQVAVQVQEELRALVSGAAGGGGVLSQSLLQRLSQHCVSSADLQEALSSLQRSIQRNISLQLEQLEQQHRDDSAQFSAPEPAGGAVTAEDVGQMVADALRLFAQDRTGMADYALESGGGSILSTRCSETYQTKAALLSLFGVPLWYFSQSPRAVIQPDVNPGNCWAFRGSSGFLVIRLSMRIRPTAVSLEHIPRALAPSRQLLSAPRDFSVYGLDHEDEETGTLLGTYTYDPDRGALQTFAVTENTDQTFQIVEVQVLSNWGHPDYTCLYRLRVHGTPAAA